MNTGDFIRLKGSIVTDTQATGVASTVNIIKRCELQYPILQVKSTEATALVVRVDVNGSAGAGGSITLPAANKNNKVYKDESKRGLTLEAGDYVEFNITTASTGDKLFDCELIVRDLYMNEANEPDLTEV
jgi:hypothetical protein